MRVVSIGDLVTDYYYKDGKFIGVNGGLTCHNIIANLSIKKIDTAVFGACGNDVQGKIAIKSLEDIKVNVEHIDVINEINTRCFYISYFNENNKLSFTSKKRCPLCNNKKWYEESKINTKEIIKNIKKDDIIVLDNINSKNQEIIKKLSNIKLIDLGQYYELENYTIEEIINILSNNFKIINLNERVEEYLINKLNIKDNLELYNILKPELLIITRGKNGTSFVYKNELINKELINIEEEVDPTGAGDAFFSTYIYEYIKNNQNITKEYINDTFEKATKLTSKVVKEMGARGHINKLYKIEKEDKCLCENFKIKTRKKIKRCNININNLESRTINALKSNAYKNLLNIDYNKINNAVFIGAGGSFAAANFASKVLNNLYGINTIPMYPRDLIYKNTDKIDKAFLFSYSGTTNDILEGCKNINNENKYIITKGEKQNIVTKTGLKKENIISYRSSVNKASERGFLSFEGAISPAVLFLKLYLEEQENVDVIKFVKNTFKYWNNYFKEYFKTEKKKLKNILEKGNTFNIFTGDFVTSACIDLESKIIESGIYNILVHEKKNFSHGRFINYEHISKKINIYFKQKDISLYEEKLIEYLRNETTIIIESRYNGILCEFDLLVASQFLIYYISNFIDIDVSKPNYSEESMKIYFYKGEL